MVIDHVIPMSGMLFRSTYCLIKHRMLSTCALRPWGSIGRRPAPPPTSVLSMQATKNHRTTSTEAAGTGTVHRVLRLLSAFGDQQHWSVNELAMQLQLPAPTVHRLLGLCRSMGYISQRADGRYESGAELYRLSSRLASDFPLNRIATPILERLRDETHETALLTVLVRNELKMFFAQMASPPDPLRYAIELNTLWPLSWGATGRSLLAFLTPAEIEQVITRAEISPQDGRRLVRKELQESLKKIREARFALTYQQRTSESFGLAAPFFLATGEVGGNIALTIPEFRFKKHDPQFLERLVRKAAADLSQQLGGPSQPA